MNIFCEEVIKDNYGQKLKQADIHREIQWHIDECIKRGIEHCGVLAPFGHGKTENVVVGRALKFLGEDKNRRIFVVCNTDDNAKARVSSITRYIMGDKDYKRIYPDIEPAEHGEWTKHKIIVERDSKSKDGSIEAWGITSSGTGGRCDILIVDDPVDMRNAILNPAMREQVKDSFKSVWLTRVMPKGIVIYIATIWHQDDLTSEMFSNPEWKFLKMAVSEDFSCIECESAFKGKYTIPLWEEVWGKQQLISRMKVIGQRAFDRGFRQKALSDDDRTFPSSDNIFNYNLKVTDLVQPNDIKIIGCDPFGKNVVIFVLAVSSKGLKVPIDIRFGKWSPTRTVNELIEAYNNYRPHITVVENNASQEAIVQWLQEKGHGDVAGSIIPFTTGKQKADPELGLPSLEVEFANGVWVVPMGRVHDPDCKCGFCLWKKELRDHPIGEAADTVMASWFAREGARFILNNNQPQDDEIVTAEEMGIEPVAIGGDY